MNCSKHNFTVLSLNIQSINAKFNNLVALVDIINNKYSKISAICLQESWIGENDDMSTFQIPNYHCISQPKFCSSHAGLLIYLHKEYNYEIMLDVSHKSAIWESLLISISTSRENKQMILGNIYKPQKDNNNNANIESFITELTPQISNYSSQNPI